MQRRFLVLHGVENWRPIGHWQWWLTERLRATGEQVLYPQLPSPDSPELERWLEVLHGELAQMGSGERVVVAHSAAVALWLLAAPTLAEHERVDRVALVAPPSPSFMASHYPTLAPTEIDWPAVALASRSRPIVISSDRDPYFPAGLPAFREHYITPLDLEHQVIAGAGHFSMDEGYGPWPSMLGWCLTGATDWAPNAPVSERLSATEARSDASPGPSPGSVEAVLFDLFGTLLQLRPLDGLADRLAPGRGSEIAARWRARQLEASWLRNSMDRWADFDVVTRDALQATLHELGLEIPPDLETAAGWFVELPLADDALLTIERLQADGIAVGVLSNASEATVERVAKRLPAVLDYRLSVDRVRRFKPHPMAYALAVEATGLPKHRIGFVTANGWDAAGAASYGLRVAWLDDGAGSTLPAVGTPAPTRATWRDIPSIFGGSRQ